MNEYNVDSNIDGNEKRRKRDVVDDDDDNDVT